MRWVEIPKIYLNNPEKIQEIRLSGKKFCLVKDVDKWVAFSAKCPHASAALEGGWCENRRVICPYHRQAFDLTTGRGDPGQGNFIHIFPLQSEGDKLYIGYNDSFMKRLFS